MLLIVCLDIESIDILSIIVMKEDAPKYTKIESHNYELHYEPHEAEGECIILSIAPVQFVSWRFILYIICNVFLFKEILLTPVMAGALSNSYLTLPQRHCPVILMFSSRFFVRPRLAEKASEDPI